jgi:hypothetical protein
MEVIRHLIQRSPSEHKKTVIRLAKNLDSLTSATARASIIWLVGEFASGSDDNEDAIAADVLRILVKGYADESDEVRAQIVLLAAKTYLHYQNQRNAKRNALDALSSADNTASNDDSSDSIPNTIELLYNHTLLLARYTPSYDLRDRARVYRALLAIPASTELASLLLLAPKPVPQAPSPSESRKHFTLGSSSLIIGSEEAGSAGVSGYEALPAWVEDGDEPDPKLREDLDGGARGAEYGAEKAVSAGRMLDEALERDLGYKSSTAAGKSKGKEKSLDAWLDEEEDDDDDDDEDDEDEDDDDEEESDEEEESSESEEDDDESEEETESDEDDEKAGLVHR